MNGLRLGERKALEDIKILTPVKARRLFCLMP